MQQKTGVLRGGEGGKESVRSRVLGQGSHVPHQLASTACWSESRSRNQILRGGAAAGVLRL